MADRPKVRHELLGRVREIENVFVPLADGTRLAARVWLPADADLEPVPAILEYLPYRKRDFMRARDEPIHRWFAAHGYATLRVDVRGSGDSDGVLADEYSEAELADALELLAWIARQPWCDGSVGMMGISWGGFNALQVAGLDPPELRAIITLCASDDRYADDAHWMGGCLLNENFQWGSMLMLYSALPPDPAIVGERWRSMWLERLDAATPFPATWAAHPWRDAYWKRGSVCEDWSAIRCPVYAIGGWADAYTNAVPRLLAGLTCPCKGLVGPWGHAFPHTGTPGPAIGFLQEALRWWDRWLRGRDDGIMEEPLYRVWMGGESTGAECSRGRWIAEREWPSSRIRSRCTTLGEGRLVDGSAPRAELSCRSPLSTGTEAGEWCPFSPRDLPGEQSADDDRSLVFDGEPLVERLEILGAPELDLEISADAEIAQLVARLCDVAPDGTSTRVTYGLLDLAHRESHEHPRPLVPGERYRVRVRLNDAAHSFLPGHRVRLALSTSYWPIAWPAPSFATVTITAGASMLVLPERPPDPADDELRPFEEPEVAPGVTAAPRMSSIERWSARGSATGDLVHSLKSELRSADGAEVARLDDIDLELGHTLAKVHRIREGDPLSAETELEQRAFLRRAGWEVQVGCRVHVVTRSDRLRFAIELEAREGEEVVRERRWDLDVERRLF